jgi:protein scribble
MSFTNKIHILQVGMRLLEVNGISLLGASHQEAVNALRNSGNELMLVVCKGKRKLVPVNC